MFSFLLSEAARLANAVTVGKNRITDEQYIINEINNFKISQRRKEMLDGEKYYAGIDDNANVPHVYLTSAGGVKLNLIMTGHELDKELFERAYQKLGEVVQLMRSRGFMVVGSKNLWDAEYCYKRLDEARDKEIINFIKGKFTLMLKEDEFDDEKLIRLIGELIEICG